MELGYNINTGKQITNYSERMIHVGNGFYEKACDITQEDLDRRKRFFASIEDELFMFKLGQEEE